jgi:hypothetical protein
VPPVSTLAAGTGILAWNSVTGLVSGSVTSDEAAGTAANIHSGPATANGPALIALTTTSPVTVAPAPGISYALDIQPIFNVNCAVGICHVPGGIGPMSLLPGTSFAGLIPRLIPGDSAASLLFQRITENNPPSFPQMPLNRAPLSLTDQNLIKSWIDKGALDN